MTLTQTALYRASLLTDNVGIRLCLAAMLVMPSALVFLSPLSGLLDVAADDLLAFGPTHDGSWSSALAGSALCVGFIGAWMRILSPGPRLVRRPGQRRFVLAALSVGTLTLAAALALAAGDEQRRRQRRLAAPGRVRGAPVPACRNLRPTAPGSTEPSLNGASGRRRSNAQRNAPITGSGRIRSITSATTTGERSGIRSKVSRSSSTLTSCR